MKVVGNCPQCGNPIWADGPEVTKRTCFCVVPVRTGPITIQIPPFPGQPFYPTPLQPYWTAGGSVSAPQCQGNSFTVGHITPIPRPPDEDAGMVPK